MESFDYPKKGKNIPPSKHDAPPKEIPPAAENDQAAQSYYDENGERVEVGQDEATQEYGDEQQE